ncbi:MAG: methyltransferase domain-containing protein [Pseudanabaenales cyanobacterium]|nr:methyltransferase domain-containing protein [Pseudanabaenales cyanobacterium]
MKYLNLGCGNRFHTTWTNLNFTVTGEGVIAHNLTQGIPFPDASFDVVYHSHLLEHFPKNSAEFFLKECHRVLRPAGILRVVAPDLEQIARTYLFALEQANAGSLEGAANYEWILLEMYDQAVRHTSGGEMKAYLTREDIPNEDFILKRCGIEAKNLIETGRHHRQQSQPIKVPENRLKNSLRRIYRFLRYQAYRREILLKLLLGREYSTLQIGRFRQSGEIHQWMYDRYSLSMLLQQCGLEQIVQRSATESYIPNWTSFNLDTEPDGAIYKPDSLYMEALKPAA